MTKTRTGATAVEAALVIPIILLFVFGGIEVVRLNVVRHTARNAAYEATRSAIIPGGSADQAQATADEILAICGIQGATVTVEPSPILEETQFVTTRVSVPMASNSWGLAMFAGDATLDFETTLRTERNPVSQAKAIEENTKKFNEKNNPPPPPPVDPPSPPPVTNPPPPQTPPGPPTPPPPTSPPPSNPPPPPSPPPVLL